MSPPSKWLFFPSPAASASNKLEFDFTLVEGNSRFGCNSVTVSGTDAGSPVNYSLSSSNVIRWRQNTPGRLFIKVFFVTSAEYANISEWVTANGSSLDPANCSFSSDGESAVPSTISFSTSNSALTQLNMTWDGDSTEFTNLFAALVGGNTANLILNW